MPTRSRNLVALCALLVSGVVACGEAGEPGEPGVRVVDRLPTLETLGEERIAFHVARPRPSRTPAPLLVLSVRRFRSEQAVRIDAAPVERMLSFLPLVFGALSEDCTFRVLADGPRGPRTLWSGKPRSVRTTQASQESPVGAFARRERVVLAPDAAAPTTIRFRLEGACARAEAGIAGARMITSPPIPAGTDGGPPSMLWVCSDQHRWDHAFGRRGERHMPALARFAEEGVRYPNAFAQSSWTLPSVASVLTGLYPRYHRTGRRVASGHPREAPRGQLPAGQFLISWGDEYHVLTAFPRDLETLAERLQRHGYTTAAVVTNVLYTASGLLDHGFDLVLDTNALPGDHVNALAREIVAAYDPTTPLFLLVHYLDVHQYRHWAPPEERESGLDTAALRREYARRVRETDGHFEQLLRDWDLRVGREGSFVTFFSDHGEHLREPDRPTERHGDSMDEVLVRVPLVVRYPSATRMAGQLDTRPVGLVDLAATALSLAGAPAAESALHGSALHESPRSDADRFFFSDYQLYGDELSSVRFAEHKLVVNGTRGVRTLSRPGSLPSTAPERSWEVDDPEQLARLAARFDRYVESAGAEAGDLESTVEIDREALEERLRELGYVE